MKIQPSSPESVVVPPVKTKGPEPKGRSAQGGGDADLFKPVQNKKMLDALHGQPEVRPEVVERARQMAQDPGYPPAAVVEGLARLFVKPSQQG